MKAYWYQGGIMIEPNYKQEIDALMILCNGLLVDAVAQRAFRSGEGQQVFAERAYIALTVSLLANRLLQAAL